MSAKKWLQSDRWLVVVLAVLYVALRLPVLKALDQVSFDGTYYLSQARVLFSGEQPPGKFPIGYPFFVAVVLAFVRDALRAGQIVSFASGLGSVLVLFALAKSYLRRSHAFFCSLLFAAVPVFLHVSVTTFSESLYLFWVLLGLLFYKRRSYALLGLAFGVASITRPEALGVFGVLAILMLRRRRALGAAIVPFVLVYAINAVAFRVWFGQLELLPKHELFGSSVASTWQEHEARTTADSILAVGAVASAERLAASYIARFPVELNGLARNVGYLAFALALFGVYKRRMYLLAAFLPFFVFPLFTFRPEPRFLVPYMPVALLYAFVGIEAIGRRGLRRIVYAALAVSAFASLYWNRGLLILPVDGGFPEHKTAGLALKKRIAKGSKIADRKPFVAFYADARYVEIPAGAYEEIMQYLIAEDVDYLALDAFLTQRFRKSLWPLLSDRAVILGEERFRPYARAGSAMMIFERVRDAPTIQWTQLTDGPPGGDAHPVWSPDGTRIMFESTRDGKHAWYTVELATGRIDALVNPPPVLDAEAARSPDGRRIARRRGSDLVIEDAETGAETLLAMPREMAHDVTSWSPDGRLIAVSARDWGSTDVYVATVDSRAAGLLTKNPGSDHSPAWSPDGRRIAVTSDRSGRSCIWVLSDLEGFLARFEPGWGSQPLPDFLAE